jgi:hypothetical protein
MPPDPNAVLSAIAAGASGHGPLDTVASWSAQAQRSVARSTQALAAAAASPSRTAQAAALTEAQLAVMALYLAVDVVQRERTANPSGTGPMADADLTALAEALVEMRGTFMHWPKPPRKDAADTFLAIDGSGLVVHKRDRTQTWQSHALTWTDFAAAAAACEAWARAGGGLA